MNAWWLGFPLMVAWGILTAEWIDDRVLSLAAAGLGGLVVGHVIHRVNNGRPK